MVQVVQGKEGFGSLLGRHVGGGLSEGLNALAQSKLQALLQAQQAPALLGSLKKAGYPDEIAELLSNLSPQERTAFFQRINPADFAPQGQQPGIGNSLMKLAEDPQEQLQGQPQQALNNQSPFMTGEQSLLQALQQNKQPQQQQSQEPIRPNNPNQASQQQKKTPTAAEIFSRPSPHERAEDRRAAWKQHGKFIENIYKQDQAKTQEDNILKRVINIREGGKARNALLTQAMKVAGIDFQALKKGDDLELEKLGKWFLRGGVALFGGRVSNQEMMNILSQVPNELQTDEGALRIANQMLNANQALHAEADMVTKILKENGGTPPLDLSVQLYERLKPLNEELGQAFIEGRQAYTTKKSEDVGSLSDTLPAASESNKGWEYEDENTGATYISNGTKWTRKGK